MFDNVNAKENEITTISMRNHRHFKISFRLLCHLTKYSSFDIASI